MEQQEQSKKGRKSLGLMRLHVRCTKAQGEFIAAYATEHGIAQSEMIRKIIESFMKQEQRTARLYPTK